MKLPRLSATTVSVIIACTLLTACSDDDTNKQRSTHSALPGQFSTLIGTGPSGSPDSNPAWFEDPVDLATMQDGSILALTKEYGRVFSISPNGARAQQFSLTASGDALSMAVQPDGTITAARQTDSGLTIERAVKGKLPTEFSKLPAAKNPLSVHLVNSPNGEVLLLKDGVLLKATKSQKFQPIQHFDGIDTKTPILAAATDGDSLLTVLPNEIAWIRNNKAVKHLKLNPPVYPEDGAAVVPDGTGGAYLTGRTTYVSHISAQGRRGTILLGIAHTSSACGNGQISGPTGDAQEHPLGEATALGVIHSQLYVADLLCHRILAIGLPAKEYIGHRPA